MIFTEQATYTLNGAYQPLPGFDDRYVNFVDYILKITEEIWEDREIWLIYDTYGEDVIIHTGARTIYGIDTVVEGTVKTLYTFPDRKMGAEAVIWSSVGDKHFYSSHRIGSTATNTGPSAFGPATGKQLFFRTIADCLVTENRIVEEWLVRDNLHVVQQLGFDPVEMAKRDQRYADTPPTRPISANIPSPAHFDLSSPTDLVHSLFVDIWRSRRFEALDQYYHVLATVHAICGQDLVGFRQTRNYLEELFASFPDTTVDVERISVNEEGDELLIAARWKIVGEHTGDGFFQPASGQLIVLPGISHYRIKQGKIMEEWMVFDAFDALCQIHANEKALAPESSTTSPRLQHKQTIAQLFEQLDETVQTGDDAAAVLQKYLAEDVVINITKPYEKITGIDQLLSSFWNPLISAFPDLENQPYILLGGTYEDRHYVSCTGNFIGTFTKEWLGIPPTQQPTWLRYSATFLLEEGKITKAWFFFDLLDVMRQAGFNFFPNRGREIVPPAPMTGDGVLLHETDPAEGQKTLDLTNAMLNGLGDYDQKTLESMGQTRFWDVQRMMWYGPSGIGTTRGLKGFEDNHQVPFITAFPDRGITEKVEKDYFAQLGDGNYSCDFGFPAMYGTHLNDDWLGLEATGQKITLRVVDYWRRDGDRLRENWVFIDMIDVLEQLGVDVFAQLQAAVQQRAAQG